MLIVSVVALGSATGADATTGASFTGAEVGCATGVEVDSTLVVFDTGEVVTGDRITQFLFKLH